MKTLRLAFSRIFTYFSENKIIFILYFIGVIACIIFMLFFYGNVLNSKTGQTQYDELDFKTYYVSFATPTEITPETLEKLKDFQIEYDIQDIKLSAVLDMDGNNIDFSTCSDASTYFDYGNINNDFVSVDNDIVAVSVDTFINNNNNILKGTDYQIFTDEELKQNVAAASLNAEKSIKIKGQDFNVVKTVPKNTDEYYFKSTPDYYIPADAYFQSGIKTWKITIYVAEPFSQSMMYNYGYFLHEIFNTKYNPLKDVSGEYDCVGIPKTVYMAEYGDRFAQYWSIMEIFAVSIFSFMFLLKYLMDSCRRENSILMMVGAKKSRILVTNFIENVILTLFSTAIAILIHIALYDCLFSKINLYENIVYSAEDYLIITLIVFVMSTIIQIPFIISYWFKNIRNIKDGAK